MAAKIRIRQLPLDYDESDLLRLCASFGDIVGCKVLGKERVSGTDIDTITVEVSFEEEDDAQAAAGNIEGMAFAGNILRVVMIRS